MPTEEAGGFENLPSPERETGSRGATSQEKLGQSETSVQSIAPGERQGADDVSEGAPDVSEGAPDEGAGEEQEPPAGLPAAERTQTSPTESSGVPGDKKSAEAMRKQDEATQDRLKQEQQKTAMRALEADARRAAEHAEAEAHARTAAEKVAMGAHAKMMEMDKKRAEAEVELLRQRVEWLEKENALRREMAAAVGAQVGSAGASVSLEEQVRLKQLAEGINNVHSLPEKIAMYRGGDTTQIWLAAVRAGIPEQLRLTLKKTVELAQIEPAWDTALPALPTNQKEYLKSQDQKLYGLLIASLQATLDSANATTREKADAR